MEVVRPGRVAWLGRRETLDPVLPDLDAVGLEDFAELLVAHVFDGSGDPLGALVQCFAQVPVDAVEPAAPIGRHALDIGGRGGGCMHLRLR